MSKSNFKQAILPFFVLAFIILFTPAVQASYNNNVDTDGNYTGSGYLLVVNTAPQLPSGLNYISDTGTLPRVEGELDILGDDSDHSVESSEDNTPIMGFDEKGLGLIDPSNLIDNIDDTVVIVEDLPSNSDLNVNYQYKIGYERFLSSSYSVGGTRSFLVDVRNDNYWSYIPFKCIAISEYATIWVPTDSKYLPMSTADGELLADEFDSRYAEMMQYYGEVSGDAELEALTGLNIADPDGDGKVAIVCYDIDGDYGSSPYVGGYFYSGDFETGIFGYSGSTPIPDNAADMIHIDSAQGMGYNGASRKISMAYDILFHELQHLVAYVELGQYNIEIPTFLNEAFSESTTHLLYGNDANFSRINWFNNNYSYEQSLTDWDSSSENILDNYSISYLFSQYLRVQYSRGETVYKDFYEFAQQYFIDNNIRANGSFIALPEYDIITKVLPQFLSADGQEGNFQTYINNFYIALAAKELTGPYGFSGEQFAYAIDPILINLSGINTKLKGGQAIFLAVDDLVGYTPPSNKGANITYSLASYNPEVTSVSGVLSVSSNTAKSETTVALEVYDSDIDDYKKVREQVYDYNTSDFNMDFLPRSDGYRLVVSRDRSVDVIIDGIDILDSSSDTAISMGAYPEIALPYGDVTGDGNIDFSDLSTIRNQSNYNLPVEDSKLGETGDLNGDGIINFTELSTIRNQSNYNKYSGRNVYTTL